MGTRGAIGFIHKGKEYITYNHYDSYPGGVGSDVLQWAKSVNDWDAVREKIEALTLVDESEIPTPLEFEHVKAWADGSVSTGEDWYSALRKAQGDLGAYLEVGYMPDGHGFPLDSLFCEWAYIIDLDANTFETYRGFQEAAHNEGRWGGGKADRGYYPVKLIDSRSLDALPKGSKWEKAVDKDEDEES